MTTTKKSVAELAHELWEARGRPHGSAEQDWIEAERQLAKTEAKVEESLADTFPASDPPATHLPDVPPSNADAKWEAARRGRRPGLRQS